MSGADETAGVQAEHPSRRWFGGALDAADSLAEVTCGLVMTLTILLTAGYYVGDSSTPAETLLLTAFGCCLAWGIIDGLLYVGSNLYDRGRRSRLVATVQASSSPEAAKAMLRAAIADGVDDLLSGEVLDAATEEVYAKALRAEPQHRVTTEPSDFRAARAAIGLNVGALLPAAVPFLLIDDWRVALRVSNVVVVATMFGVGMAWGRLSSFGALRSGVLVLVFGVSMVAIAVALGG